MKILKTIAASAAILLLLTMVGCDLKTSVDYDRSADFSAYKTYDWADPDNPEIDDLTHRRVLAAVDTQMQAVGFQKVDSNPDVYVTYFGDDDERTVIDTNHMGYGFGGDWYWGGGMGMSSSTSTVRTYNVGTLVVDIYDAAKKELVWRGAISGTVSDNPQKNEKNINKGLTKLFKSYPPDTSK